MNLSIPKRFLIITAAAYICSFLFFLILNYIQFAPKNIDVYFKGAWLIRKTLLDFFDSMIAVQCTAVIFTFSFFYPRVRSESGIELLTSKNFNQLVTIVIIILLTLTAVFFSANEIFKPMLFDRLDSYQYLTDTSRTYLDQATEALNTGRLFEAEELTERYLAIKPEDSEGEDLLKTIGKRIDNQYIISQQDSESQDSGAPGKLELDYDDAIRLARGYLENQDYYSAYYYSRIAADLSNGSQAAKDLSSEAWAALSRIEPSREEAEAYSLYSQKKRGTELLLSDNPIEAYYLFNRLAIDNPEDPDIAKYLKKSIEKTVNLTYFIDDAEKALTFPGVYSICFLNSSTDNLKEVFYFGKMVTLLEGTFFKDIEVVSFDPSQGIKSHLTAEYGKLVGDHIVLNGIDRENSSFRKVPVYIVSRKLPELYNTIKLNVDSKLLHGLSGSENIYKKMSILELFEFEPIIQELGWSAEPLFIEIIYRILQPCAFIILSLIMIAVGWKYRRFEGKIPAAGLIFSPIIIYILVLFSDLYLYGLKILCSWLYLDFGKAAAGGLLIASQAVLLITAFLLIAGLRTSEKD